MKEVKETHKRSYQHQTSFTVLQAFPPFFSVFVTLLVFPETSQGTLKPHNKFFWETLPEIEFLPMKGNNSRYTGWLLSKLLFAILTHKKTEIVLRSK